MFRAHPCCRLPSDTTPIWRYFDFAKFVSMLDAQALFFPSVDSLEDPLEGAIPWPEAEKWPASEGLGADPRFSRRDRVLISSWHANPDESIAMWKLYSRSTEAIAIRSTVGRLKSSLSRESRFDVFISAVEYINFLKAPEARTDPLSLFLRKANPYAYENEVRALVDLRSANEGDAGACFQELARDRGVQVRADLPSLIEMIHVSPFAGAWFLDLVRTVLRKFGCTIEAKRSVLAEIPERVANHRESA